MRVGKEGLHKVLSLKQKHIGANSGPLWIKTWQNEQNETNKIKE